MNDKICRTCGATFRATRIDKIYCSKKCCNEWNRARRLGIEVREPGAKRKRGRPRKGVGPYEHKNRVTDQPGNEQDMTIAQMNALARQQGKTYGQLQAELYAKRDRRGKDEL